MILLSLYVYKIIVYPDFIVLIINLNNHACSIDPSQFHIKLLCIIEITLVFIFQHKQFSVIYFDDVNLYVHKQNELEISNVLEKCLHMQARAESWLLLQKYHLQKISSLLPVSGV